MKLIEKMGLTLMLIAVFFAPFVIELRDFSPVNAMYGLSLLLASGAAFFVYGGKK